MTEDFFNQMASFIAILLFPVLVYIGVVILRFIRVFFKWTERPTKEEWKNLLKYSFWVGVAGSGRIGRGLAASQLRFHSEEDIRQIDKAKLSPFSKFLFFIFGILVSVVLLIFLFVSLFAVFYAFKNLF